MDRSEESIIAEADSADFEEKLRAIFECEHFPCARYMDQYSQEILDDLFELRDGELFSNASRKLIAKAIVRSRCRPLLDPRTGELAEDLQAIVHETLKIAREEMK